MYHILVAPRWSSGTAARACARAVDTTRRSVVEPKQGAEDPQHSIAYSTVRLLVEDLSAMIQQVMGAKIAAAPLLMGALLQQLALQALALDNGLGLVPVRTTHESVSQSEP